MSQNGLLGKISLVFSFIALASVVFVIQSTRTATSDHSSSEFWDRDDLGVLRAPDLLFGPHVVVYSCRSIEYREEIDDRVFSELDKHGILYISLGSSVMEDVYVLASEATRASNIVNQVLAEQKTK